MTPERADEILRGVVASLQRFIEELEVIDAMRKKPTPAVQHLLSSMRQSKASLEHLIARN